MKGNDAGLTLPSGKLPPDILQKKVLVFSGTVRKEVLIGPRVGEDAAVIDWEPGKYMIVASDPIVGAAKKAGRLLVTVNANDIASKGGDPLYLITTIIFPSETRLERLEQIMEEIHEACLELGVALVGGHTEVNDRYNYPVIVATMIGAGEVLLKAENIAPGDVMIATKHVGLEGMSILANDRPDLLKVVLSTEEIREVTTWINRISVLPEARVLRKWAKFMHDPTEGGLIGGISEVLRLTSLGFELEEENLPVHPLTRRCADSLNFDPGHLISSGVLLAVLAPKNLQEALGALREQGIEAQEIGRFTKVNGNVRQDATEVLWELLERPKVHE